MKIASVEPHIMEDNLLLSFEIDWIKKFDGIPEFDVMIDNGKLVLISQQKIEKI